MSEVRTVLIGSGPTDEKLVDPGHIDYYPLNNREMNRWRNTLTHLFGMPPDGAYFSVVTEKTEFGEVRQLAIKYHTDKPLAAEYAHRIERDMPVRWIGDITK